MKEAASGAAAKVPAPGRTRAQRSGPFKELGDGASGQARQEAAAILEVLAGVRTPAQAAAALGVSLAQYYILETRAVQAIVVACEPRPRGRQVTAASSLATLRQECEQLRRDCARQQALARTAQRALGLAAPAPPAKPPAKDGKQQRRARRPMARAMRAVARLKAEEAGAPPAPAPAPAAAADD